MASGYFDFTSASAPATIGAASDVPVRVPPERQPRPGSQPEESTSTPGAETTGNSRRPGSESARGFSLRGRDDRSIALVATTPAFSAG